ncbi:nose resistant to fluoxetine protein 6-like [Zophobas morio]|uniref:nose resistant to fluoxetine protein 6-like n=1 Tax=Zophobas morio TaxID=2755281 RepID=UPI0030836DBF
MLMLNQSAIKRVPTCCIKIPINKILETEYASMPEVFHLDDYDRCMLHGPDALYCSISFQLYPKTAENTSDAWKVIEKVSNAQSYYRHDLLRHGICVSQRCPNIPKLELLNNNVHYIKELSDCYSTKFERLSIEGRIRTIYCQTRDSLYPVDFYDYIVGIILLTIIALVITASLYDAYHSPNFSNEKFRTRKFGIFLSSFSIIRNWKKLTTINLNNPDAKALSSLQGIRFYNVVGVIIAHTFTINMAVPILNPRYMESLRDRKIDQFWGLGSRYVTMQTFFLMSIWLLTYKFYKDNEGTKEVPFRYIIQKITSRYLRLTPLMATTILFAATWMPHISKGPLWNSIIGTEYNLCRSNLWNNFLFISNIFPFHEMCANHLWHIAMDMQFCVLALIILLFLWKHPKRRPVILLGLWVFHVVDTFFKTLKIEFKEVDPESSYNTTLVNMEDNLNLIKATATNIPAIIAGVIYGIIKKACEWPPVYILGRLTYGAYLIHPFIQRLKAGILRTPNFLNDYLLIFECLGYVTWSFLLSIPLTLFFEMPFEEIKNNTYNAMKKIQKNRQRND